MCNKTISAHSVSITFQQSFVVVNCFLKHSPIPSASIKCWPPLLTMSSMERRSVLYMDYRLWSSEVLDYSNNIKESNVVPKTVFQQYRNNFQCHCCFIESSLFIIKDLRIMSVYIYLDKDTLALTHLFFRSCFVQRKAIIEKRSVHML